MSSIVAVRTFQLFEISRIYSLYSADIICCVDLGPIGRGSGFFQVELSYSETSVLSLDEEVALILE